MGTYEIRFLRPDGNYGAIAPLEAASDPEANAYVIENYGQKPLELWKGDEQLARRTSSGYERRLRNDPYYPSQLRFAAMGGDRSWDKLTGHHFEAVGSLSDRAFRSIRAQLAPYPIWVRATSHAQAPPQVDQKVRVSIFAGEPFGDEISGSIHCDLWSREADGETVCEDCRDVVTAVLVRAVAEAGGGEGGQLLTASPWRDGIYTYLSISVAWRLTVSSENTRFRL